MWRSLVLFLLVSISVAVAAAPQVLILSVRTDIAEPTISLAATSQAWLAEHPILRVGIRQGVLPPYSVRFETDVLEGISADYLSVVSRTLKRPLQILRYQNRDEMIAALERGDIDLLAYYTPEGMEQTPGIKLTMPYSLAHAVMVQRHGEAVFSNSMLAHARILHMLDNNFSREINSAFPAAIITQSPSPAASFASVAFGNVDVLWTSSSTFQFMVQQGYVGLLEAHSSRIEPNLNASFAVASDNQPLLNALNSVLENIPQRSAIQAADTWGLNYSSVAKNHPLPLNAEEQRWLDNNRQLTVNIVDTDVPFVFKDQNGELSGFTVELLNLISQRTGLTFNYKRFGNLFDMKADLRQHPNALIAVSDASAQLNDHIRYSRSYTISPWVIVTRKDAPPTRDMADLRGKKVAVYYNAWYLAALRQRYPDVNFIENRLPVQIADQLLDGRIDGAIVPYISANYFQRTFFNDQLRIAMSAPLEPVRVAMAASESNPLLLSIIDKALSDIPQSTAQALLNEWLRAAPPAFASSWQTYKGYIWRVIGIALIVILFFVWRQILLRRALRKQRESEKQLAQQLDVSNALTADLELAREKAQRASESKSIFLSQMSHEIRTPLSALIGLLELENRRQSAPEQRHKNIEMAWQASRSLQVLVGEILDLAKIEAGRYQLHPQPLDLARKMQNVQALFQQVAHEKGLELTLNVELQQPWIVSDATALRQILSNLVSNAIKFTDRGAVEIACYQATEIEDGYGLYVMEVCDSGSGLSTEQQVAIFEPFVQASDRSHQQQGTGLGLSICRHLAELLGGELSVESEEGEGATFMFRFKAQICAPATAAIEETLQLPEGQQELHLLIVEDHAANRLLLTQQLEYAGYQVTSAENGEQALTLWNADPDAYNMMITDCHMPGMSGLALTQAIRKAEQQLQRTPMPIYGLTAMAEENMQLQTRAAGMNACLFKPLELRALLAAISAETQSEDRSQQQMLLTIDKFAAGDAARWEDFVTTLLSENRRNRAELLAAAEINDRRALHHAAHQLRGSANVINAARLHQACGAIEQAANSADINDFSTLLATLLQELDKVDQQLELALHDPAQRSTSN